MTIPWTAWGETRPELTPRMTALLGKKLGPTTPTVAAPIEEARLPAGSLSPATIERLRHTLGSDHVRTDDESRARHAGGQSYAEIIRRRAGDATEAPDAVLFPTDAAQVAAALDVCSEEDVAVVPWGGGTSVVGGLAADRGGHRGLVALDLSRLDALVDIDEESLTATFQPGIRTPDAEAALAGSGLTLGHV